MVIKTSAVYGISLDERALEMYVRAIRAGCPLGVNSSYRDPNTQAILFHENYIRDYSLSAKYDRKDWGGVIYWRRRYNSRTGGGTVSVAIPGTSEHERGKALDLPGSMYDSRTARGWMHRYGEPFGWFWPAWAQRTATREEWHLEFNDRLVVSNPEEEMELTDPVNIKGASAWAAQQFGQDSTTIEHLLAQLGHAPNITRALAVAGDAKNNSEAAKNSAAAALKEVRELRSVVDGLVTKVGAVEGPSVGVDEAAIVAALVPSLTAALVPMITDAFAEELITRLKD